MTARAATSPPPDGLPPLADMCWIDCADLDELLLILLDDPGVGDMLRACGVDAQELRAGTARRIAERRPSQLWRSFAKLGSVIWRPPGTDADRKAVDRVLTRAMIRAGGSDGRVVGASDVLIELLDKAEPETAERLGRAGLTRYDAVRFVSHGLAKGEGDADLREAAGDGPFHVVLLNDNFTPMDDVVAVLTDLFDLPRDTAISSMLDIHRSGSATIGTYDPETARSKLEAVARFARDREAPLRCVLEHSKPDSRGGHAELLT